MLIWINFKSLIIKNLMRVFSNYVYFFCNDVYSPKNKIVKLLYVHVKKESFPFDDRKQLLL